MSSIVWSNVVIDILLVVITCGGFIYGAKCGIIKVLSKPLKWFSSFILASIAAVSLSSTVVMPAIEGPIVNKFSERVVENWNKTGEVPTIFKLMGVNNENFAADVETISADFLKPVILILSAIITFFAVLLLGKIVIGIVLGLLNFLVNRIGIMKIVSKISGAVVGLLLFFIIATAFARVFELCASLDLLANIKFFGEFSGGFIFDFMTRIWTKFFGF